MTATIIVLFLAWLAWTYFVYQCGYNNAVKDAEAIAGRKLWFRQELVSGAQTDTRQLQTRVRYTNVPPWEE